MSNDEYPKCNGCYSYDPKFKKTCIGIHKLYNQCPCHNCLVKIVCNTSCPEFFKHIDTILKKEY